MLLVRLPTKFFGKRKVISRVLTEWGDWHP